MARDEMIDQNVTALALACDSRWSELQETHPLYRLDGSWPSLGVLDRMLQTESRIGLGSRERISEIAAYIGRLAHSCWE
ncbi:MAG: hypothetical protein KDD44_07545, partial [Bdellovibrionales bacterium]|nr:hypothetical protein [Bdellovibrionales bacterium]